MATATFARVALCSLSVLALFTALLPSDLPAADPPAPPPAPEWKQTFERVYRLDDGQVLKRSRRPTFPSGSPITAWNTRARRGRSKSRRTRSRSSRGPTGSSIIGG